MIDIIGDEAWVEKVRRTLSARTEQLPYTVIQLDRKNRGQSKSTSQNAVRQSLRLARNNQKIVLVGLCPLTDYQKNVGWEELSNLKNVNFFDASCGKSLNKFILNL